MMTPERKMDVVKERLQVESVEGFSGHSDRRQIFNYINHLHPKPERVIVCHGERTKCHSVADFIERRCGIPTLVPVVMETFRLL